MMDAVVKKGRWRKVWKDDNSWTDRCRGGWKDMKVGWRKNRWRDVKKMEVSQGKIKGWRKV